MFTPADACITLLFLQYCSDMLGALPLPLEPVATEYHAKFQYVRLLGCTPLRYRGGVRLGASENEN